MAIRLGLFLGIFALIALLEGVASRRGLTACTGRCGFNNPPSRGKITGYAVNRRQCGEGEEPRP